MGKINPLVGVYIPIIRIPIKGGMTIPNIATFDHGTYGCQPKNRGGKPPKMDGLFHGKPYEQMDDLGVPLFLETPIYFLFHAYLGK